ncbi:MAG TPA: FKBP-type peptidyl-prolyl cis-trans isomerase [Candidatus Sulfotelmatobacter sp.]|nr:FKBP-type peptidyl-prolyl cis-trans isomerase [Candidatus Sulfotelmatobacter sp.]
MIKNIIPLLIVLAVIFSGVLGIFFLSNQKTPQTDINFNPTQIPSPTNAIIQNTQVSVTAAPTNMDNFQTTQDGLKFKDEILGTGQEVKAGDTVTVNYLGTLENGTKFDSSYDRNTPFTTQIGVGQVIKGWDEGIVGMKVGGKRKLIIPSSLGYGEQGAGNSIPPNSTLIFEVELLSVK